VSKGTILPGIAPNWRLAIACAAIGHLALGAALVGQRAGTPPRHLDPVMVIELPAGIAPPSAEPLEQQLATAEPLPNAVTPDLDILEVNAPLPSDPVTLPTPRPIQPTVQQPAPQRLVEVPRPAAPVASAAPATASAVVGTGPGADPNAKREANDWYALVAAHLERNKRYPREARRDGITGTPTVRFAVNRRGRVSDVSIRNSSGNAALDEATIELLQRVSPLPAMPRSMGRDSVIITLPIEYSLSRK